MAPALQPGEPEMLRAWTGPLSFEQFYRDPILENYPFGYMDPEFDVPGFRILDLGFSWSFEAWGLRYNSTFA